MQELMQRIALLLPLATAAALAGCGGTGVSLSNYTIGGSVAGLSEGSTLVLANNGGDSLTVSANGSFTFATPLAPGAAYAVTVAQQPNGQTCTVTDGSGTLAGPVSVLSTPSASRGDVTAVAVTCAAGTGPFTIGGAVSGLIAGNSLELLDNGNNPITVSANGGFEFTMPIDRGSAYAVTVGTQPAGQTCAITNGSGADLLENVSSVSVVCSDDTFNVGVTVSGLTTSARVVLEVNGGDALTVTANGTVNFNTALAENSAYTVSVLTQPVGENCVVTGGSGTVHAGNVIVPVTCTVTSFTVGGTVSGLAAGKSVALLDNGGNGISVSSNGAFTFLAQVASGSAYSVTVKTQPTGETCAVTNGSGTVAGANVTNIAVTCTSTTVNTYTIGGTISGLSGSVVLQNNGGDSLTRTANGSFTFTIALATGATYAVSVSTQPSGQSCSVSNGTGTVAAANVTNVLVSCAASVGSNGNFIWEGGSQSVNSVGSYGTLHTPSSTNLPPARDEAVHWQDAAGNYWMFGGENAPDGQVFFNDLWKYSPASDEWTWEGGSSSTNQLGVYGTLGTAAAGNAPGSRTAAASWIDASGNLWLFGGLGCDNAHASCAELLNDLWEYTPGTGLWTWVSGSDVGSALGVYGTQGQASAANVPGGRSGLNSWIDAAGNFWLLGGEAIDKTGNFGHLNDLWKFSPMTKEWTWVGGSSTYNGPVQAVYGTPGQPGPSVWPGASLLASATTDAAGNFWLFGGQETVAGGHGDANDLWTYSPASGEWTSYPGQIGNYGTEGSGTSTTFPPGRQAAMAWQDATGNFWVFGGGSGQGLYGDLWKFSAATGFWTWVGGSSALTPPASYGTIGTPAASNTPGGREGSAIWQDSSGNFWLFGGGIGFNPSLGVAASVTSDLWEIVP